MLVWYQLETTCPLCGNRLRVRQVGSGFAVGQDSDLFVRMEGTRHLIQAEIHTCRRCRFSGYPEDFVSRSISRDMEKSFLGQLVRDLHDDRANGREPVESTPLPHVQYHWAALAATAMSTPAPEVGRLYLRAYWCLRLSPSADLPDDALAKLRKLYLRHAISRLRQGVRADRDRAVVYLIGELCRRNANFGLAAHYFERYVYREKGPRYLKQAARKLLLSVADRDSTEKTMEEILYDSPRADRNDGHYSS